MRFFTCVLDPEGRGISDRILREHEALPRERGLKFHWKSLENAAVLTGWDDSYGDPLTAEDGDWFAAGVARLDNRQELERWVHRGERAATDLHLVLRLVARYGSQYISKLLGDFAFITWNGKTRTGVAACDAFAVQKVYYAERGELLVFSSRAEGLAVREQYEPGYLLALLSLHERPSGLSVYRGVRQVPRASLASIKGRSVSVQQYWSAAAFAMEPSWEHSELQVIDACLQLLMDSVRQRFVDGGMTWAQLSGGLDSSSVVSLVQWLAERGDITEGLAGTVTFVDHRGTGADERSYSDAVIDRWKLPNLTIVEPPMWLDWQHALPLTDQPLGDLHVYPRDLRLCVAVRSAGGRVLLTGNGGDQLFTGNMLFFADWLAQGRVWPAIHEMARRAAIGRVSFWELAYRNALLPLLPRAAYMRLAPERNANHTPSWLKKEAMHRYAFATAMAADAAHYGGPVRSKYHHVIASVIASFESMTHGSVIADVLDVRHPLLYRPLVEFALRLPPALRARPHAHRWVLREAMRGILPEKVRTRVGKPGTAEVLGWSLMTQRVHLARLTHEPILASLGLIDGAQFREALDTALNQVRGAEVLYAPLIRTLAVEKWLQIRCGRWSRRDQLDDGQHIEVGPKPILA